MDHGFMEEIHETVIERKIKRQILLEKRRKKKKKKKWLNHFVVCYSFKVYKCTIDFFFFPLYSHAFLFTFVKQVNFGVMSLPFTRKRGTHILTLIITFICFVFQLT